MLVRRECTRMCVRMWMTSGCISSKISFDLDLLQA